MRREGREAEERGFCIQQSNSRCKVNPAMEAGSSHGPGLGPALWRA